MKENNDQELEVLSEAENQLP